MEEQRPEPFEYFYGGVRKLPWGAHHGPKKSQQEHRCSGEGGVKYYGKGRHRFVAGGRSSDLIYQVPKFDVGALVQVFHVGYHGRPRNAIPPPEIRGSDESLEFWQTWWDAKITKVNMGGSRRWSNNITYDVEFTGGLTEEDVPHWDVRSGRVALGGGRGKGKGKGRGGPGSRGPYRKRKGKDGEELVDEPPPPARGKGRGGKGGGKGRWRRKAKGGKLMIQSLQLKS